MERVLCGFQLRGFAPQLGPPFMLWIRKWHNTIEISTRKLSTYRLILETETHNPVANVKKETYTYDEYQIISSRRTKDM